MRLPRFTTRRLMVLVAVVAIWLCAMRLVRQALDYQRQAAQYASLEADSRETEVWAMQQEELASNISEDTRPYQEVAVQARKLTGYQAAMRQIYERAARYPWLPLPPDPPIPQPPWLPAPPDPPAPK